MAKQLINQERIKEFFNDAASYWDEHMITNDRIINIILDNARVNENAKVLDVACGTGVLIPYYLQRNVNKIVAIDISEKMIDIAQSKFNDRVEFICGDVINTNIENRFDNIVVYNAFPHFINQEALIQRLSSMLKEDACLTIAHSMSRDAINKHHKNVSDVSCELISIEELSNIVNKYLKVETKISNDEMYQIVGRK